MEFGIRDIYDPDDRQPLDEGSEELEQDDAPKQRRRGRKYPKRAVKDPRPADVAAESDY